MTTTSGFKNIVKTTEHEPLAEFLENAPVGIHLIGHDGVILYANAAELQMLGYTRDEYFGHSILEFHVDPEPVICGGQKLLNKEELINYQSRMKCKDGSVKDVLISSSAYFKNNTFTHTRCFTRDITKLKKAEKLLRFLNKAGEELSATHNTSEAIDKITKFIVPEFADWFVINELRDDGYAYLLKMAHVDPQKVVWAEKYRKEHPIDLNDQHVGSVGWAMRTGQPVLASEITPEIIERGAKDAEQKALLEQLSINSVMIIPMQVKQKITGVVSFMSCNPLNAYDEDDFNFAKDFTNRIALTLENTRLYEEVKKDIADRIEADKKKDEFISIASHELRTPVTSLKAYTQILQMTFDEAKNEKAASMLAKMDNQVDKLTGLIVDLLDVTKIDKGELIFEQHEFDFNELVKEIAEEMQRTTHTHSIQLELSPCERIEGDKNRIGQVITNFISNAIKYSPDANEVILSTACENNIVKLSVRDFGIGIREEEQSRIFRRFFRATSKTNYTFPGLGLGLYISAEIIKRHGGRIYFESTEGSGSTFCFEIVAPTSGKAGF